MDFTNVTLSLMRLLAVVAQERQPEIGTKSRKVLFIGINPQRGSLFQMDKVGLKGRLRFIPCFGDETGVKASLCFGTIT